MTVRSRAEILRDLTPILQEALGVQLTGSISEQTRCFGDLGLASIDAVVLGEAIQHHYAQVLPFHELLAEVGRRSERDLSLGELVDFLDTHLDEGIDRDRNTQHQ
jgi:acyl carrier protein